MNIKLDKNEEVMELEKVLDVVGEKLPNVIKSVMDSLYTEKSGSQIGKSIASLHKELLASGMDKKDIMPLLRDYMNSFKNISTN